VQFSSQYSSDLPEFRLEAVKCVAPDFDFSNYLDMCGVCIVENADVCCAGVILVFSFRFQMPKLNVTVVYIGTN